ncbi:hypothetical protein [Flavobacterium sp. WC2430]|uniref:hypothetical protein n=1 Tax=Flavobacterium sp. WC2430 TaxID=3234137 RepID=UPI0034670DC4
MKNLGLFLLLISCIGLQSCKKEQSLKDAKATPVHAEIPTDVACYKAMYESDTIEMKMITSKDNKITGDMTMSLYANPKKVGKIKGEFHGDTLLVDYSFYQGADKAKIFTNPMAFLKRGDSLILGNGKIEYYFGKSYFVKGQPIDYDNVKYKLTSVDCVDK